MAEPTDALEARREAAELLGLDLGRPICPADNLKVDLVLALRRVIDAASESGSGKTSGVMRRSECPKKIAVGPRRDCVLNSPIVHWRTEGAEKPADGCGAPLHRCPAAG
jgi:hypothetical protein